MLDFLFITSPSNALNPYPPFYYLWLAAYLRDHGLSVKIIDPKGRGDHLKFIVDELIKNPARFIGLASFHSDYDVVMELGYLVKQFQPNTALLVGNVHATLNPEDFIFNGSPFDVAVIGEGEKVCSDYVFLPEWSVVKGVAYQDDNFSMMRTEPREFMDLSELPAVPAYDLINMDWYLKPRKLIVRRLYTRIMPILAGRGCPYNCTFCCSNAVWKANKGRSTRLRSVDNAITEIIELKHRYKIDFFYFSDDMFGLNKKWMKEWFESKEILDSKLEAIPYGCQTRADVATEEMIRNLKESNCIQLDIGVESGDQKLLDLVNKKISISQIEQIFEWCRKYKLRAFCTLMINMPEEIEESIKKTELLLKRIKPCGVAVSICTPYPGTKIYTDYMKLELKKEEYYLLQDANLRGEERFRMASHGLDLHKLRDRLSRRFKAIPIVERMFPFDKVYWKAVWESTRFWSYIKAWIIDLLKSPLVYLKHRF